MQQPPLTSPLVDLFLELCAIPSPPGEERAVADRVVQELDRLGLEWYEDDAAARLGSSTGNIVCRVPATADEGVPLLFCAHLDTVPVEGELEPALDDDGLIRNAGGAILGADNKSAVVAMLEAVRRVVVEERPHAGIELVFTPKEEIGLLGATELDVSQLRARAGFVYDQAAPIGEVVVGAPSAQELVMRFHGRPAHAGMYPEEGRSAVLAAARAIVDMPLGRIDDNTSANVGLIDGGSARNVVPEWCELQAEVRLARPRAGERGRPAARSTRLPTRRRSRTARSRLRSSRSTAATGSAPTRCRCGSRATGSGRSATSRGSSSRAARPTRTSSTSAACPA